MARARGETMVHGGNDGDDPFAGVVLDDDFVRAAERLEPSAAKRGALALAVAAERQRLESAVPVDERRRERRPLRWAAVAVAVLAVAVIALAFARKGNGGRAALWSSGRQPARQAPAGGGRPTPRAPSSPSPLRRSTARSRPGTAFAFLATQPASGAPVTYDPCRSVPVVVNLRTAPAEGRALVTEALAVVGDAAGLVLWLEDTVTERPAARRALFQPDVYGDRWAPVLVAWSDPSETPGLAGSVAGLGGSAWVAGPDGHRTYVTGDVTLDGPQIARLLARPGGRDLARSVILHELGHLVGLDHVDAAGELMRQTGVKGHTAFGPGDLSGFARLAGAARCEPAL